MSEEEKGEVLDRAVSFAGTETMDLVGLKKRIQISNGRRHSYWDGYLDRAQTIAVKKFEQQQSIINENFRLILENQSLHLDSISHSSETITNQNCMFEKNIKQLQTSRLALDSVIEKTKNIERVAALDTSMINPCEIKTGYYCPVKPTLSKASSSALEAKSLQLTTAQESAVAKDDEIPVILMALKSAQLNVRYNMARLGADERVTDYLFKSIDSF